MIEELKACPFCQLPFEIIETTFGDYMVKHDVDCPAYADGENGQAYHEREYLVDVLNNRPIEDALRAENARLREEIEHLKKLGGYMHKSMQNALRDLENMRDALKGES